MTSQIDIPLLDGSAFYAQEVIQVLLGDKPVASISISEERSKIVLSWAKRIGLHAMYHGEHGGNERGGVLLAKTRRQLDSAADLWTTGIKGQMLGYPDCCVAAYKKSLSMQAKDSKADVIAATAAASGTGPYSFLLNTMMSFTSGRCSSVKMETIARLLCANEKLGTSLKLKALISWHPCSFKCRPSLAKALRTWLYLKRCAPKEAELLKAMLDKPTLYLSWSKFAAFEGRVEGRTLRYSRVVPPFSFLSSKLMELIRAGDNVRLASPGVRVCRGDAELGVIPADSPRFLPFKDGDGQTPGDRHRAASLPK